MPYRSHTRDDHAEIARNYLREEGLSEDHEPIKQVPGAVRKAWEPKSSGYTRAAFDRDRAAREEGGGDGRRRSPRERGSTHQTH